MIRVGFVRGVSPDRWLERWHDAGRSSSARLVGYGEGLALLEAGEIDILLTRGHSGRLDIAVPAQSVDDGRHTIPLPQRADADDSPTPDAPRVGDARPATGGLQRPSEALRPIRLYSERVGVLVARDGLFQPDKGTGEPELTFAELEAGTLMQELYLRRRDHTVPEDSVDVPNDAEGEQRALRLIASLVENDPEGYVLAPLSIVRLLATRASSVIAIGDQDTWWEPDVLAVLPPLAERHEQGSATSARSGQLSEPGDRATGHEAADRRSCTEDELQDFIGVLRGRKASSGRMTQTQAGTAEASAVAGQSAKQSAGAKPARSQRHRTSQKQRAAGRAPGRRKRR